MKPASNKATTDTIGFDTFGDSESRKITAISELQSPDRTNSPSHVAGQPVYKHAVGVKEMKAYEDSDDIAAYPYGNKTHNQIA